MFKKLFKKENLVEEDSSIIEKIKQQYYIQKRTFGSGKITFQIYKKSDHGTYSPPVVRHGCSFSTLEEARVELSNAVKKEYKNYAVKTEVVEWSNERIGYEKMTFEELYKTLYKKYNVARYDYVNSETKISNTTTFATHELFELIENLQETYAPKIKIPKWVADVLDKMIVDGFTFYDFELDLLFYYIEANNKEDLIDWLRIDNAINAIEKVLAYLNPLTRKFVEVVE